MAFQKFDEFVPGSNFVAWVGQFVRYVALNERRRIQRERKHAIRLPDGVDPEAMPENATTTALNPALARALGSLDETARSCLLMRTVTGMSYKEIAAALSIPEGTAMSHVFRSRAELRTSLGSAETLRKAGSST